MGLFKRETSEQKRVRLERERELDEIYQNAKFIAQKEAAERDGRLAGLTGKKKHTFMDRLSDVGKVAGEQMKIMEDIIGEPPKGLGGERINDSRSTPKRVTSNSKQTSTQQPIVIVIDKDKLEKKKQKNTPFTETWEI